jgi:hypothetical protein
MENLDQNQHLPGLKHHHPFGRSISHFVKLKRVREIKGTDAYDPFLTPNLLFLTSVLFPFPKHVNLLK